MPFSDGVYMQSLKSLFLSLVKSQMTAKPLNSFQWYEEVEILRDRRIDDFLCISGLGSESSRRHRREAGGTLSPAVEDVI